MAQKAVDTPFFYIQGKIFQNEARAIFFVQVFGRDSHGNYKSLLLMATKLMDKKTDMYRTIENRLSKTVRYPASTEKLFMKLHIFNHRNNKG